MAKSAHTIQKVEVDKTYDGYDSVAAIEWCSPSFLGFQICISASADNGEVVLTVTLKTPIGNYSKQFSFSADVSFTWQPIAQAKVTLSVTGFTESDGVISFTLGLKPCIDVPILGWKCYSFSNKFNIPIKLAEFSDLDNNAFASLIAMSGSSAGMLQGDIYNNYMGGTQAGFPTVPVVSCVTCTGVSPICASQAADTAGAGAQAGFPTVPVVSCVTCTGVSPICASQAAATVGAGSQVGFPTVPVVSCVTCTGVSPICASQAATAAGVGSQVGFPTVPVVSCVTCTGVSPICASQAAATAGAGSQVGFPTVPVVSCVTCTGVSPICASQAASTAGAGSQVGFPTVPVVSCVTCTGVSPICASQANVTNQVTPPPTILPPQCTPPTLLPQCAPPTVPPQCLPPTLPPQCLPPTLPPQCLPPTLPPQCMPPTANCTGIPIIC